MTGWRVGWMIGPKDLVAASANLQSHATSNVANVSQRAALAALTGDLSAVEKMKTAFDRRRKTIVSMLNEIEGVYCPMPEGAFYAYPQVKGLLGKDYDGRRIDSSAALAEYILDAAEVAIVPGEAFRSPGYLRLSYALGDDDLIEGITRLYEGLHSTSERLTGTALDGTARERSLAAPEGAPPPALHRVHAAPDAWSKTSPSATGSCCPTRSRRTGRRQLSGGRREGLVPRSSSGSTTWRARCCERRLTYADWSRRPPRTTSATADAGWRSRSTRRAMPRGSAASPPSPTWSSTACATPRGAPASGSR